MGRKQPGAPQIETPSPSQFYPGVWCRLRCSISVTGSSSVRTGSLHMRTGPAVCSAWLCPVQHASSGEAAPASGVVRHKGGNRVSSHS